MVDLLNPNLRARDLRKLVEPHLFEVNWENGVDETSEWVVASFEEPKHEENLVSWLENKKISSTTELIITDLSWSNLHYLNWSEFLPELPVYFRDQQVLAISSNRSWILEYAPQQIARFGRWVKN
ncbi:hypothetical protein [Catenovulum maritimum]|uniref:Uncharacterized protein n=1 Tax=Catenovulum maritimum TaxID=1513271 RepID=A0A0J8GXU5_9ALTE|nr:hypothetical protein [Catenovulum maritimum]KMT66049.1 hypothetical protein XM47_06270 [Catenovulum maritimum]